MTSNKLQNFRISTTSDLSKGNFFLHGIAMPTTTQYKGFSETLPQADGGQVQHGYKNIILTWVSVDARTVYKIKQFVDSVLAGTKRLYMTIPMNDGTKVARTFIDVYGRPYPTDVSETAYPNMGIAFDNLTLTLNNVTIVNNPSNIE